MKSFSLNYNILKVHDRIIGNIIALLIKYSHNKAKI